MEKANEVASFFLWLVIAIFVLHVIQGDAMAWIKSKFTAAGGSTSGGVSTGPGTANVTGTGSSAATGSGDVAQATVLPNGTILPYHPSPDPVSHGTPVGI